MRESPTLKLIEILLKKGAEVAYHDPYIPSLPKTRKYSFEIKSTDLSQDSIKRFDAVLISTDHDSIDYKLIAENADLILDTRNIFGRLGINSPKIYKA